jgi:type I restriction-modification system DNA methylase subunit
MSNPTALVQKLWNYCSVLRDDGVGTLDYTEQLTYLLFLKMAHERANRPINPEQIVPDDCSWQRLLDTDAAELEKTYRYILETLAKQSGTLGVIFRKAQNKIQDPAKLKKLIVELIDAENWSATGELRWVADRNREPLDPRDPLDDYTLVNLNIERSHIAGHLDLALRVKNLLDENAREPSPTEAVPAGSLMPDDFPLEERSFHVTARLRF